MNGSWARPIEPVSPPPLPRAEEILESRSGSLLDGAGEETTLIEQFERVVAARPSSVAATCGSESITYDDLNRAANRIAHALLMLQPENGAGPEAIVAVYLDRSIPMLAAMLGVLKAGCAYLPIDPGYPAARVLQTLEDASPAAIVTSQRLASGLPALPFPTLLLPQPEAQDRSNPPLRSTADSLAYLMYTSGSTGKPKGVLVTQRNVMRLFTQTDPWFHFDETDVWTMFHSFAFDFSVWEIWGPLLTGGRLVIVPFEISRSTEEFYALLSAERVTVLNQTPSAFYLLDQIEAQGGAQADAAGPALPIFLRTVIFGGEALQYPALRNWFQRHGDQKPRLVNMYGITETTVHVTYREVTHADALSETDSLIGEPIPDLQLHLLREDLTPVSAGAEGELCIGGAGVAKGYLNRPELTAQRFMPNPFSADGGLLYRSGDLARRRADGQLVYLGRNDQQVKINGFRIELGEVESAIAAFPGIHQVSVVAHPGPDGRQRLAAYFVADAAIPTHTLSEFLAARNPAQMLPSFYIQIPAFPLTGNGKIDRAALPKPVSGSIAPATETGTPMQQRVATIWREALETPSLSLDDNFFDIGGSSILLIRIRAELQRQLDIQIPITWMFEFTTIREIADRLAKASAALADLETSNPAPSPVLTAAQQQARRQREAFARMRTAKGGRS